MMSEPLIVPDYADYADFQQLTIKLNQHVISAKAEIHFYNKIGVII
jgi:hypothetical protein